ncbi:MAG: methylated-DNA--[protein]-cysteine S-methyltransferase [Chloroflexi bacterium]|nr:methylated-DNA--[protein]-cysteine S-methyltransferase [Chloroflexota bacterium]
MRTTLSYTWDPGAACWSAWLEDSPLGVIRVWASPAGLTRIALQQPAPQPAAPAGEGDGAPPDCLAQAVRQLDEYLHGRRQEFSLPIDWGGRDGFLVRAQQAACAIPFGQVRTYGELARSLGRPTAARAVGSAMAHNPLPPLVPCHRLVNSQRGLNGYYYGLEMKAWLLALEGHRVNRYRLV